MALILTTLYVGSIKSLLLVPREEDRLKTFGDLVKEGYRIQMRGNRSSTYLLMQTYNGSYRHKALTVLTEALETAPANHGQYLKRLATVRKTAAMNTVRKLDNYLRFIQNHYTDSECFKGEEIMFVTFL